MSEKFEEFIEEINEMKKSEFWHKFLKELQSKEKNDSKQNVVKESNMSSTTMTTATQNTVYSSSSPSSPLFSSSAFFDPTKHPTIVDQVSLCREIAKQLVCDESNAKSKGREMFERRVQKSSKWVTQSSGAEHEMRSIVETEALGDSQDSQQDDFHERTISEGPPNLRLVLDPRHVQDINSLLFESNEEIMKSNEVKTRDSCKHIVEDLTSPEVNPNKGNALFAKRAQKSSEWIVAESVVEAAHDKLSRLSEDVRVDLDEGHRLSTTHQLMTTSLFYPKFRDFNSKPKPFVKSF